MEASKMDLAFDFSISPSYDEGLMRDINVLAVNLYNVMVLPFLSLCLSKMLVF